jgi:hypothetical protein
VAVAMRERQWTLFTNQVTVFIPLLEHPEATIRTIAAKLGLAERTVVGVLQDLRRGGYLLVRKEEWHKVYGVNPELNRVCSAVEKQTTGAAHTQD